MDELVMRITTFTATVGYCDECGDALDIDRSSISMRFDEKDPMRFHQTCAWKRATFAFGELF